MNIHEQLNNINERIKNAAKAANRDAAEIRLIAVSKTKPVSMIQDAVDRGHLIFGENRVQEALPKIEALREVPGIEWHLVGHLQKNKARFCVGNFQWLHSLDTLELAHKLEQRCDARKQPLNLLIQLNLSAEDSKSGLSGWEELLPLAEKVQELKWLKLRGLMTMPAPNLGETRTRQSFSKLRELRDRLRQSLANPDISELSMGMTADFEWAILEGATMIRVGSAIFGARA